MIVLALFYAFITRMLFCLHVLLSVGLVVLHTSQPLYWTFLLGAVFMLCEMVYVMVIRKGVEYKYFWPSCFLYLSAIIPVIWVMELDLLKHRLDKRDQLALRLRTQTDIGTRGLNIEGIGIAATIQVDMAAKKVCELGVILLIILGRWLLPRGKMTRDQLSNLLLGYIGMGADILELFAALSEPPVMHNTAVTYATLVLFSWSMLQFCIVATATAGSEDTPVGSRSPDNVDDGISQRSSSVVVAALNIPNDVEGPDTSTSPAQSRVTIPAVQKDIIPSRLQMSAELFQIVAALLMQDGPFFLLRLGLWFEYGVSSEIHVFFTAKNALTVILMLYRLYILLLDAYDLPHLRAAIFRLCSRVSRVASGVVETRKTSTSDEQAL